MGGGGFGPKRWVFSLGRVFLRGGGFNEWKVRGILGGGGVWLGGAGGCWVVNGA